MKIPFIPKVPKINMDSLKDSKGTNRFFCLLFFGVFLGELISLEVLKIRQQDQNGVTYSKPHVTIPRLNLITL